MGEGRVEKLNNMGRFATLARRIRPGQARIPSATRLLGYDQDLQKCSFVSIYVKSGVGNGPFTRVERTPSTLKLQDTETLFSQCRSVKIQKRRS
jgi:hypothetical protein